MKIERITCGQANVFLIHGNNASILVDTGTKKYRQKVLECCQKANVKLIILTHGHFDHCQNARDLSKELHCLVGIGRADRPLLEENEKRKVYGKGLWGGFYAWASNHNILRNTIEKVSPDIVLETGASLREYGIEGSIVQLSGHTKGSIGLVLSTGELFVGDAMQNIVFPAATWCYEDYQPSKESAMLIKSMDVKKVYYGHGRMTEKRA